MKFKLLYLKDIAPRQDSSGPSPVGDYCLQFLDTGEIIARTGVHPDSIALFDKVRTLYFDA